MEQVIQQPALEETSTLSTVRGILALAAGWVFTMVWCSGVVLVCALTFRVFSLNLVAPAAHTWSRVLLWLCGVKLTKEGWDHLEGRAPRVLIVNHPSTLDIVLGGIVLPPAGHPVGKREILYYPFLNFAWWALRFGTIDRSSPEAARRTLDKLVKNLHRHELSVVMAPEGTRSPDGTMGPFKKGAFHLAMQAGVPVYPVVIAGAERVWPRKRLVPIPGGEVRLRCLGPVDVSQWSVDNLDEHVAELRETMLRNVAELSER
jgi:1-acyl-sn-glycerol-3-phosphate acyltransferase